MARTTGFCLKSSDTCEGDCGGASEIDFLLQGEVEGESNCLFSRLEVPSSSTRAFLSDSELMSDPTAVCASGATPEPVSDCTSFSHGSHSLPNRRSTVTGNVGREIWKVTTSFLALLRSKTEYNAPEGLSPLVTALVQSTENLGANDLILLLHALRVSVAHIPLPLPSRKSKSKRHCKSHRKMAHKKAAIIVKRKTGRKPQAYSCYVCHEVCPYRVTLIKHFQDAHGVNKSQSLLYKRIKQGPECMQRLYSLG